MHGVPPPAAGFDAARQVLGSLADGAAFESQVATNLGVSVAALATYVESQPAGSTQPRFLRVDPDANLDGRPDNFATAYFEKYDAGLRKAVSRSRRNRSTYHSRMCAVAASTYTVKSKKSLTAKPERPSAMTRAGCRTLRPSTITMSGRRIGIQTPGRTSYARWE